MPQIRKFSGINNVARPVNAGRGDLQKAVNVLVDDDNVLVRRSGYTSIYSGTDVHSLNGETSDLLYVDNDTLYAYDAVTPTMLLASLTTGVPMGYFYLNNNLYFSNGHESGIYTSNGAVRSWGLTAPPSFGAVAISGNLAKGTYQVALTYVRDDGQESAPTTPVEITLPDGGGIRLLGINASADATVTGIGVYCTGTGGEVLPSGEGLYRYLVVPNTNNVPVTLTDLASLGTGAPCRTFGTYPPPAGNLIWFYRGRVYIASGQVVWYTEPWQYEHVKLDSSFMIFPDTVTNGLPVENGIWLTTATESMFLSGKDPLLENGFEIRSRTKHACYRGGVLVNSSATDIKGATPGIQAMWVAEDGVYLGDGIGIPFAVTSGVWEPQGISAGTFGHVYDGQYYFGFSDLSNYTMNLSNKAVCEFDRQFISMISFDGTNYGADGVDIYEGQQADDDSVAIAAEIEKSGISFNSSAVKKITEVYLHAGTTGPLRIEVTSESGSGTYDTPVSLSTAMKGHKAHGPRGVKGRNFTINVQNVDGVDFALDEIETVVGVSMRHGR